MSTERRPQKTRILILQPDDQAWLGMRHRPWAHLETSRKAGQRANSNGKTSSCTRSAFRPWRPSFPKSRAGLEHIFVRHPLSRALKTSGPCRRITSPAGVWPEYPPCMTNILQKSLRLMPLASIRLPHVVMIIICVLAGPQLQFQHFRAAVQAMEKHQWRHLGCISDFMISRLCHKWVQLLALHSSPLAVP